MKWRTAARTHSAVIDGFDSTYEQATNEQLRQDSSAADAVYDGTNAAALRPGECVYHGQWWLIQSASQQRLPPRPSP